MSPFRRTVPQAKSEQGLDTEHIASVLPSEVGFCSDFLSPTNWTGRLITWGQICSLRGLVGHNNADVRLNFAARLGEGARNRRHQVLFRGSYGCNIALVPSLTNVADPLCTEKTTSVIRAFRVRWYSYRMPKGERQNVLLIVKRRRYILIGISCRPCFSCSYVTLEVTTFLGGSSPRTISFDVKVNSALLNLQAAPHNSCPNLFWFREPKSNQNPRTSEPTRCPEMKCLV